MQKDILQTKTLRLTLFTKWQNPLTFNLKWSFLN